MKVRRDTRMTTHLLFRPSSFSKVCAEIWKKNFHCGLTIAQNKCAKGCWFCTLERWEGHQRQMGSHISVNVKDIVMPIWHFHLRQQPSLRDQDGVCSFSQCIFSLRRVTYFHNSVALKNTMNWDCVGCLRMSSTMYFVVQLLRYYKAISIDRVTAAHLF